MGALHHGHGSLIRLGREHGDEVFVTVFVNPTQFGPQEDLSKYPRTLAADVELAGNEGASLVFAPEPRQMYPEGDETRVVVPRVSQGLCGLSRPGHFEGVATVVTKFFALAGEVTAIFGRKDYQQLQVIRTLVRDLLLPVRIVGAPTVRAADGLAESSRNAFLSAEERAQALAIPRALTDAQRVFRAGERDAKTLREAALRCLEQAGLAIDYVELAHADTLAASSAGLIPERTVLAVAAKAGSTRLIDNTVFGEDDSPLPLS